MFRRIGVSNVDMIRIKRAMCRYREMVGNEKAKWGVIVSDDVMERTWETNKDVEWEICYSEKTHRLFYYRPFYQLPYERSVLDISERPNTTITRRVVDIYDFMGKVHMVGKCGGLFDPNNRIECKDFATKMLFSIEKRHGIKLLIIVDEMHKYDVIYKYDMVVYMDGTVRYMVNGRFFGYKKISRMLDNHKWSDNYDDNLIRVLLYFSVMEKYNYVYSLVVLCGLLGSYGIICSL